MCFRDAMEINWDEWMTNEWIPKWQMSTTTNEVLKSRIDLCIYGHTNEA